MSTVLIVLAVLVAVVAILGIVGFIVLSRIIDSIDFDQEDWDKSILEDIYKW